MIADCKFFLLLQLLEASCKARLCFSFLKFSINPCNPAFSFWRASIFAMLNLELASIFAKCTSELPCFKMLKIAMSDWCVLPFLDEDKIVSLSETSHNHYQCQWLSELMHHHFQRLHVCLIFAWMSISNHVYPAYATNQYINRTI